MDSELAKAALLYLARAQHTLVGSDVPTLMGVLRRLDEIATPPLAASGDVAADTTVATVDG